MSPEVERRTVSFTTPSVRRSGAWAEGRALLHAHRGALALGFGLVLVNRIAALVLPASSKYAIDEVIGQGRLGLLLPISVAALSGVAVQSATAFGLAYFTGMAAERAVTRLRQQLYAHVLRLPVRTFDSTPVGTLVSRLMTDAEQIRTVLGPGLVQLASSLLTAGLALGVLFVLDAPLTLFLVILLLATTVALSRAFGWFRNAFLESSVIRADLTSRLGDALTGIRIIKAFAAERNEACAFLRENHRLLRTTARGTHGVSLLTAVQTLMTGLTSTVVLLVLIRRVATGGMTLGDLALYVMLAGLLVTPLLNLMALAGEAGRAFAALQRLHELRMLPVEGTAPARRPASHIRGDVTFDGVSYAYLPGQFALRDISFVAPAGSVTALVGPSGSGKSTICRLLLAFDEPTLGRVLVDGEDVAKLRLREYRSQVGAVLEDGVLFDGTIGANIKYARPSASQIELRQAARQAHCDEFVSRLPRGYETPVGERGIQLSAGQRQRIAIARAMLSNPRILVLDEATSHLDIESEALVQDALRMLRQGRTTFVVAHQPSSLRGVDHILMLQKGRIIERGTCEQLADVLGLRAPDAIVRAMSNGRQGEPHDVIA